VGDARKVLEQGTRVRVALDAPRDVTSNKRLPGAWRESDVRWSTKPRTITKTLMAPGTPIMYLLDNPDGSPDYDVLYTKNQLQVIKEEKPKYNIYEVSKLVAKKKEKGKIYYRVRWKGYDALSDTWEKRTNLMEDCPKLVKEYDRAH